MPCPRSQQSTALRHSQGKRMKWAARHMPKMALYSRLCALLKKNIKKADLRDHRLCMCEYTSHGHCGILCGHDVDNDQTLEYLSATAVSHAAAGADMVAPSDMMDGRIAALRAGLDENGFKNTPIMSYAIKYASKFYGPFREAAGSAPSFWRQKNLSDGPSQCARSYEGSSSG